jgi:hypothetical protein
MIKEFEPIVQGIVTLLDEWESKRPVDCHSELPG